MIRACWNWRIRGHSAGRPVFCARAVAPGAANSRAKSRTAQRRFANAPVAILSIAELRKLDVVLGQFDGDHSLPFAHHIKPVGSQIGEGFFFPIRPEHFGPIETLMAA